MHADTGLIGGSVSERVRGIRWTRAVAWALVILITFISLFPLWWVVRTALTNPKLIFQNTTSLLPVGFTLDNFARALGLVDAKSAVEAGGTGQTLNFFLFLRNSIIVSASRPSVRCPSARWRRTLLPGCAFRSATSFSSSTLRG
ncbi:MAG: hypothetical protein M5R40_06525 [Anaerolineae bacterium]|nr:hypothetical protein [Anaerolineae bacterium]